MHTNECLLSDLVRKGRINSLFGSLIVNMAHIDSSFAYFGSPKGSPKYCKRLVNMSAYSLSGNRITRNYSTFMRLQAEICKRTGQNIRPYFHLFFSVRNRLENGFLHFEFPEPVYAFQYETKIRMINSNFH